MKQTAQGKARGGKLASVCEMHGGETKSCRT